MLNLHQNTPVRLRLPLNISPHQRYTESLHEIFRADASDAILGAHGGLATFETASLRRLEGCKKKEHAGFRV